MARSVHLAVRRPVRQTTAQRLNAFAIDLLRFALPGIRALDPILRTDPSYNDIYPAIGACELMVDVNDHAGFLRAGRSHRLE